MSTAMSRRTMLRTAAAATTGVALAGASGLTAAARAATAQAGVSRASAGRAAASTTTARVGATVNPRAYNGNLTWDQAMAKFNKDVGRDFEVAKRYFQGPKTWPTKDNIGVYIQSLVDEKCRGLLCFQPPIGEKYQDTLHSSLKVIQAVLPDAKVTLYQEQGLAEHLTAADFKQVYDEYSEAVLDVFPLFVDFAGAAPDTWAAYRPAGISGIAVDYYADAYVRQVAGDSDPLSQLVQWADEAGQELGFWEIGNTASGSLPHKPQVEAYFSYLSGVQSKRLATGNLVGDMAWYNGPHDGGYYNTISGAKLSPLYKTDRPLLDHLFDTFNGSA
jgi:hypothetical protein